MIDIFRDFFIIASYNFRNTIKKGFFKIFTIVMTLLIIVGVILPDFIFKLDVFKSRNEYLIYIVDDKNYIFDNHIDLNLYSRDIANLVNGEYYFKLLDYEVKKQELDNELNEGNIDGYLIVNSENSIDIVTSENYPELKFILDRFISNKKLEKIFGLKNDDIENLYIDYNVKSIEVNKNKIKNILETYTLPIIFMVFTYITFIMYGQLISVNANIEKNSKIVEIFLTKVRLSNIILGKVFGILFAGIIQVFYFVFLLFLIVSLLNYQDFPFIKSVIKLDVIFVFRYFIYFILGFILYGFMFLLIGNIIDKTEDVSSGVVPIVFLISLGYFFAMISLQFPQNYLINVLEYVPFFTPFVVISNSYKMFFSEIIMLSIMVVSIIVVIMINISTFKSIIRLKGNKSVKKR